MTANDQATGKVLLVDDDTALLRALRIGLVARGYEVSTAVTGSDGLSRAALDAPDVVVLDLGLPDMDGIEVCRRIRQWSEVPIVVLSAAGSEETKVQALDGGADDYVTKPFGMAELEARLRVALRHGRSDRSAEPSELTAGWLRVDLVHHLAFLRDEEMELTAREFDLLAFLVRHVGKICTHRMILGEVWGPGYGNEAHYLRVFVHRLRKKLGDDSGITIKTDPGIGYRLLVDDS
ncbi:MAG TPA: response regulator transcription factor [Acidimicrobiales bacterium]|nr:response regulator transcription factor [Acidimicrobiales bacterium]